MNLLAVDPGNMTGIASFVAGAHRSLELNAMDATATLDMLIRDQRWNAIAVEEFIPRGGAKTWQPDALFVTGAIRYFCHRDAVPFMLQTPTTAKRFAPNSRLVKLGWRNPSKGGHADDASRHLVLLAAKLEAISLEDLLD